MSRCFTYPPPGYALTSARKGALIELIKFQKEKVKADELRKKEKKREKKDERIQKQVNSDILHRRIGEKFWADAKADFLHKGISSESEQLEGSSLTEEHGKPACMRVPTSSSDSTENSNKRKRPCSPVDVSHGHGRIIRIRVFSKKLQNQVDASVDEQRYCSTSGRTEFPPQAGKDTALRQRSEGFCSTSGLRTVNFGESLVPRERIPLASKQIETIPLAVSTPMQKECLVYRNLIEKWVPPRVEDGCLEEDWLFGKVEKKSMCREERMPYCNTSSSPWPRAQYLPEVDICALPYTMPF